MTDNTPPPALVAAIANPQAVPQAEDRLISIRAKVAAVRDLEARKVELEESLKSVNLSLQQAYYTDLPDAFDELGVAQLTLAPEGNHPGVEAKVQPFYRANIAQDWPPEQRNKAFDYLKDEGAEDLIKTEVIISMPRGFHADAVRIAADLSKAGYAVQVREAVPWQTMTAWLKEQVERLGHIPTLDLIGGTVGRVVKLKNLKS